MAGLRLQALCYRDIAAGRRLRSSLHVLLLAEFGLAVCYAIPHINLRPLPVVRQVSAGITEAVSQEAQPCPSACLQGPTPMQDPCACASGRQIGQNARLDTAWHPESPVCHSTQGEACCPQLINDPIAQASASHRQATAKLLDYPSFTQVSVSAMSLQCLL